MTTAAPARLRAGRPGFVLLVCLFAGSAIAAAAAAPASAGLLGGTPKTLLGAAKTLANSVTDGVKPVAQETQVLEAVVQDIAAQPPQEGPPAPPAEAAAPPAESGPLGNTLTNTVDTLTGLLGGDDGSLAAQSGVGLTGLLEGLLCPPVDELADLVEPLPGVGEVAGALRALICSLHVLGVQFHSVWQAPDGSLVERTFNATIGVPRLLNIDNRIGPDVIATLGLGPAPSLDLAIDRVPLQTAPLPASIEAVLFDPTGGALPAERIAVGVDELDNTLPSGFRGSINLAPLLSSLAEGSDPVLDMDLRQRGRAADTSLLFSIFDGTPTERVVEIAGRLDFGRSWSRLDLRMSLGDPLTANLSTDQPGPLTAQVQLGRELERIDVLATIEELPDSLDISFGFASRHLTYHGFDAAGNPKGIDRIDLDVTAASPLFARAKVIDIGIDDFPGDAELTFSEETLEFVSTQRIGRIDAFVGSEPQRPGDLPPGTHQGARYVDVPTEPYVIAARVLGLRHARVDFGALGAITVIAETDGGPFDGLVKLTGLEADVQVRNLPSRLEIGLDLLGGTISYQASAPVGRVQVDVRSAGLLPPPVDRISAVLEDLPESFDIGFNALFTNLSFASDVPIGKVEVMARSSDAADERALLGTDQGAVLRLLDDKLFVFGRIRGLKRVAVNLAGAFRVETETNAGQALRVDAKVDDDDILPFPLDATALVEDLPSKLDLTADLVTGKIGYEAAEQIDLIEVAASSPEPVFNDPALGISLSEFEARLRGIPVAFQVGFALSGADFTGASFTSDNPIESIEVMAASAGADDARDDLDDPATPGPDAGMLLRSFTDETFIFARVLRLRGLTLGLDPIRIATSIAAGPPALFLVDVVVDNPALLPFDLTASGAIRNLPSNLDLTLDLAAGQVIYEASERIDRVELAAEGSEPFVPAFLVDQVEALIEGVPQSFTVGFAISEGPETLSFTSTQLIDLIEIKALSSGAADSSSVLDSGAIGAVLRAGATETFAFARVRQLREVRVGLSPIRIVTKTGPDLPLIADAVIDNPAIVPFPLTARADINNLPSQLDLTVDLPAGLISYAASDEIDLIDVSASSTEPVFNDPALGISLSDFEAGLTSIPRAFNVNLAFSDTTPGGDFKGVSFNADKPIGQIEALARSLATPDSRGALGTSDGAVLRARGARTFVFARVSGLRHLAFGLDPISVSTETAPGRPLRADAIIDNPALLPFDLDAEALVEDLPSEVDLTADLAAGEIGYSASGPIDLVSVQASSSEPIFEDPAGQINLSEFGAVLNGVPASFTLDLLLPSGEFNGFDFTTNNPIGEILVFARSEGAPDRSGEVAGGGHGAVLVANPAETNVFARVLGFRRLAFKLEPISVVVATAPDNPFNVHADVDLPALLPTSLAADLGITNLPGTLGVGIDLGSGEISYFANEVVERIELVASTDDSDPPLIPGIDLRRFDLKLLELPRSFGLGLGLLQDGGPPDEIDFTVTGLFGGAAASPIGSITLTAKRDSATPNLSGLLGGAVGAIARIDESDAFAHARVEGIEHFGLDLDPIAVSTKTAAGERLFVDAEIDAPELIGTLVDVEAEVNDLPSRLDVSVEDDGAGGLDIGYSAGAPVESVRLEATHLELTEGSPADLRALLDGLPAILSVDVSAAPEEPITVDYTASGGAQIERIRVMARDLGLDLGELSLPPLLAEVQDIPASLEFSFGGTGEAPLASLDSSTPIGALFVKALAPSNEDVFATSDAPLALGAEDFFEMLLPLEGDIVAEGQLSAMSDFALTMAETSETTEFPNPGGAGLPPIVITSSETEIDANVETTPVSADRLPLDVEVEIGQEPLEVPNPGGGDPFLIGQDMLIEADLSKLPFKIDAAIDLTSGGLLELDYDATQDINDLGLVLENVGIDSMDLDVDDVPEDFDFCFETGDDCDRDPNLVEDAGDRHEPVASLDFRQPSSSRQDLELDLELDIPGDDLSVDDAVLSDVGFGIGLEDNPEFEVPGNIDLYVFLDSNNHGLSADAITFGDLEFKLGTESDPFRFQNRLLAIVDGGGPPPIPTITGDGHCGDPFEFNYLDSNLGRIPILPLLAGILPFFCNA